MSAHTPGPWSLPHFAQPDSNCQCGYVLCDDHMGAICTVHASGEGDWQVTGDNPKFNEAVANARLIAAAPDLMTAAKEALSSMESIWRTAGHDDDWIYDEMGSELAAGYFSLRAAIAKATGETP